MSLRTAVCSGLLVIVVLFDLKMFTSLLDGVRERRRDTRSSRNFF